LRDAIVSAFVLALTLREIPLLNPAGLVARGEARGVSGSRRPAGQPATAALARSLISVSRQPRLRLWVAARRSSHGLTHRDEVLAEWLDLEVDGFR
jgi:hypothetical protein